MSLAAKLVACTATDFPTGKHVHLFSCVIANPIGLLSPRGHPNPCPCTLAPQEYKLAAVRGSVDDATCAALLALRLGRGSSVRGMMKDGRTSDASEGASSCSRASGSHDSNARAQAGKAELHSSAHLSPLPENESVLLASKTVGSDMEARSEARGDPAAQQGGDTCTQHDNNPGQGHHASAGTAGADEAKAVVHGFARLDAASKRRPVDAGDIFEAELGLMPNSLSMAVTGPAPKVPTRA